MSKLIRRTSIANGENGANRQRDIQNEQSENDKKEKKPKSQENPVPLRVRSIPSPNRRCHRRR